MRFAGSGRIALAVLPSNAVKLGIRAENIETGAAGAGHMDVRVHVVEWLGSDTYVCALVDDGTLVTVRQPGNARYTIGESISLRFDAGEVRVFDADGRGSGRH